MYLTIDKTVTYCTLQWEYWGSFVISKGRFPKISAVRLGTLVLQILATGAVFVYSWINMIRCSR